ncbi:MAG: HAD hydrolase-like protein [Gemmatimonadaceae bacterium]|nr:HAD hydrolase-like protein [Gemmatimonadaceae bacterium]MDQ3243060.1 HAD hydrolase-like protein [Gemmatimonadota bacterium]
MRVVLFDIDGTLLKSEGVGRISMESALTTVFGAPGNADYHYDGKTDRQIVRDLMRLEGFSDEEIDGSMEDLLREYLERLHTELASGMRTVHVFAGVRELLDALELRDNVVMGLLTGNVEAGARAKLDAAGIDMSRFRVNAFGSDNENRPELPGVAQRRASELLGTDLQGNRVIVIGDTPADIRCGEKIGARAIGVATGRYSVEELSQHDAYAVFETLADTTTVMETILNA